MPFLSPVFSRCKSNSVHSFRLMHKELGSPETWDVFFDANALKQSATVVLRGMTSQLAAKELLQPAITNGTASVTVIEDKLQIRTVSLFIMTASFIVMTLLSMAMILLLRKPVVPQGYDSIATHAMILAQSPSLDECLEGTGHLRTSALRKKLDGLQFRIVAGAEDYSIQTVKVHALEPEAKRVAAVAKVKGNDWIPFAARIPLLFSALVLPILLIAILEALQKVSNAKEGVLSLNDGDSGPISYVIRYASTLVVLIVATLFNNLDFTITSLTPFSTLRWVTHSTQDSMLVNLLGHMPPVILYRALRFRHFSTFLSVTSALLGSVLAIIVSGLWTADNQVMSRSEIVAEMDGWTLTWRNNSYNDNGAAALLNTIDYGGASQPLSVWQDAVVPEVLKWHLADAAASEQGNNVSTTFEVDVLALRPELACTLVPSKDIRYINRTLKDYITEINRTVREFAEASFKLPDGCWTGPSRNISTATISFTASFIDYQVRIPMLGMVFHVDVGTLGPNSPLFDAATAQRVKKSGCPSFAAVFGRFDNATALLCSQKMQRVPLRVRYQGSPTDNVLDPQVPPSISTTKDAEYALDPESHLPTHQYRFEQHLKALVKLGRADSYRSTDSGYSGFLKVFDHLVNGPYNISIETLRQPNDTDLVIDALKTFYNSYMTLVIDRNFRTSPPSTTTSSSAAQPATTTTSGDSSAAVNTTTATGTATRQITRLKMNNASKLTLQIMLAVMTLFMAVAVKIVRIRHTLPRSPYSIASVMGFLAGSRLCAPKEGIFPPPGSEVLNQRETVRLLKGWDFRLGWWQQQQQQQEGEEQSGGGEAQGRWSEPADWNGVENGNQLEQGEQQQRSAAERDGPEQEAVRFDSFDKYIEAHLI
jgi:Protein of unknown function (DUF3433)